MFSLFGSTAPAEEAAAVLERRVPFEGLCSRAQLLRERGRLPPFEGVELRSIREEEAATAN